MNIEQKHRRICGFNTLKQCYRHFYKTLKCILKFEQSEMEPKAGHINVVKMSKYNDVDL